MPSKQYLATIDSLDWKNLLKKLGLATTMLKEQPKYSGYLRCFLHKNDNKASLCLYKKDVNIKWCCFGCRKGGDKFDFVSLFLFGNKQEWKRTARWFEKHFGIPSPYREIKLRNREKMG
jgi:DNA primase